MGSNIGGRHGMVKLEDINKDALLKGIEPDEVVRVVTVDSVGDNAVTVYYKLIRGVLVNRCFLGPMKRGCRLLKLAGHGG